MTPWKWSKTRIGQRGGKSLYMRLAMGIDEKPITPAKAIKTSKIANLSTAMVRRKTIYTVPIFSIFNYARACEEDETVRFVDAGVLNIVGEVIPSNVFAVNYKGHLLQLYSWS